jgi:hypothetical protein
MEVCIVCKEEAVGNAELQNRLANTNITPELMNLLLGPSKTTTVAHSHRRKVVQDDHVQGQSLCGQSSGCRGLILMQLLLRIIARPSQGRRDCKTQKRNMRSEYCDCFEKKEVKGESSELRHIHFFLFFLG